MPLQSSSTPPSERDGLPVDAFAAVNQGNARQLLIAAVESFAEAGYSATTTRDIAGRVAMSPAGLYVHYRSKEDLLYEICRIGHKDALREMTSAVAEADGIVGQLEQQVYALSLWHARNHLLGRVIQLELRSLPRDRLEGILPARRRINALVRETIEEGVTAGHFRVPCVSGVSVAIVSLCSDVARWFQLDGGQSAEELADLYVELSRRMVGLD